LLVSDSEVLASGSQSYKQFIDSVPASSNKTQTVLVMNVGHKIWASVVNYLNVNGMEAEIANYAGEFNRVKDTTQNVFCMPGGNVVVYEGLPITQDEEGLAAALWHEIAYGCYQTQQRTP
jgi:predicted Zn-dependent protease